MVISLKEPMKHWAPLYSRVVGCKSMGAGGQASDPS